MKNKIVVVLALIVLGLSVALIYARKASAQIRQELAVRKEVWGKLWELSLTYPEGLRLTVPDKKDIIVRNQNWESGIKFEFGADGLTAKRLDLGNEVGWSYLIK